MADNENWAEHGAWPWNWPWMPWNIGGGEKGADTEKLGGFGEQFGEMGKGLWGQYQETYAPLMKDYGAMLSDLLAGKETALTRGIYEPIERQYAQTGKQLQSQLAAMGQGRGPRGVSGTLADVMAQTGRAEAAAKTGARTQLLGGIPGFGAQGAGLISGAMGGFGGAAGIEATLLDLKNKAAQGDQNALNQIFQLVGQLIPSFGG